MRYAFKNARLCRCLSILIGFVFSLGKVFGTTIFLDFDGQSDQVEAAKTLFSKDGGLLVFKSVSELNSYLIEHPNVVADQILFATDDSSAPLGELSSERVLDFVALHKQLQSVKTIFPLGNMSYFQRNIKKYEKAFPNLKTISGYTRGFKTFKEGKPFPERPMYAKGVYEFTDDVRQTTRLENVTTRNHISLRPQPNASPTDIDTTIVDKMIENHEVDRAVKPCLKAAKEIQKDFGIFSVGFFIGSYLVDSSEMRTPAEYKDIPYEKLKVLSKRVEALKSVCTPKLFKEHRLFIEVLQAESYAELEDRIRYLDTFLYAENIAHNFGICARPLFNALSAYAERCLKDPAKAKEKQKLLKALNNQNFSRADLAKTYWALNEANLWRAYGSGFSCSDPARNREILCQVANLAQDMTRYPNAILHGKINSPNEKACSGLATLNKDSAVLTSASCEYEDFPQIQFNGWRTEELNLNDSSNLNERHDH